MQSVFLTGGFFKTTDELKTDDPSTDGLILAKYFNRYPAQRFELVGMINLAEIVGQTAGFPRRW